MRRFTTPTLLVALAAGAAAQFTPESNILEAYSHLRESPSLSLSLDATETYLGRSVRTQSTVRWSNAIESGRDVERVEVVVWTDGTLVQRVVCDGLTVWSYDTRRNRYSALPVDRTTGTQATTYRTNIESALAEAVGGTTVDALRLAREAMGGGAPTLRPWMPGVAPVAGSEPWQSRWAVYNLSTGQPKSVTFEIGEVGGQAVFSRFHRTGSTRVGRDWRVLDEVIDLDDTPVEPTSPAFVFIPPRNAVSVPARAVRF